MISRQKLGFSTLNSHILIFKQNDVIKNIPQALKSILGSLA